MVEDRSLDDFLRADEGSAATDDVDAGGGADSGGDHLDGAPGDDDADGVDPATVTASWSPTGAVCDACGASVDRRWLDDGDYVCESCKEW